MENVFDDIDNGHIEKGKIIKPEVVKVIKTEKAYIETVEEPKTFFGSLKKYFVELNNANTEFVKMRKREWRNQR